jgi:hypothetical protein
VAGATRVPYIIQHFAHTATRIVSMLAGTLEAWVVTTIFSIGCVLG